MGAGDIYPEGLIPDLQEFIDDAIDWIGPGVRELIDDARRLVASLLDQEAGNYLDRQRLRQEVRSTHADAKAYALLEIEAATGPGSALAQALLSVQVELEDKADAAALLALTTRVTETENGLIAVGQALLDVEAEIAEKADASALLALTVRVEDTEDGLLSLSQALIDVQTELLDKADASAVLLLQSQVNSVEVVAGSKNRVFRQSTAPDGGSIPLQGGDLWIHTSENNRLYRWTPASGGQWVLSEDQRIPQLETDVTAVSNAVIALQSTYNDVSASANFRMTTSAGPSGYAARIGAEARTGGAGTYRSASWFLDVPAITSQPTRFVVLAQQTAVMTAAGVVAALFDGDTTYINNARIRNLTATNINVEALTATEGFFDYLVVEDGMIPAGLITDSDSDQVSGNVSPTNSNPDTWVTVASITLGSPSGHPITLYSAGSHTANVNETPGFSENIRVRIVRDGTIVLREANTSIAAGPGTATLSGILQMEAVPAGDHTYTVQIRWKRTVLNPFASRSYSATLIATAPRY